MAEQIDVLMVEDEAALAASTVEYLNLSQIKARAVGSAEEALAAVSKLDPRLILLDVNLPGASGFEFCRRLRKDRDTPVVFISARTGEDDQILALTLGGDDYIVKPYSLALLVAKVRRTLARSASGSAGGREAGVYDDGWLAVDLESSRVSVDGAEIALAAMEFDLLAYLVANRGRVVEKRELLNKVWGGAVTGDGTLAVHVRRLRRRIEPDPDNPAYICTVWGRGYRFREGGASLKAGEAPPRTGEASARAGEAPARAGEAL